MLCEMTSFLRLLRCEMLSVFEQIAGSVHEDQGHPEMEATQPEILAHQHRSHFLSLPKHEPGVSICSCMS